MMKWSLVLTMASACLPMAVDARQAASTASSLPLEPMSHADAEQAGAVGTGCTWRGGPGRKARLSMADDRAAVRRNGIVVALKPAADAKGLFFTYDRWIGVGIRIVVRDSGKVVSRGHEFSETVAWITMTADGLTRTWQGHLNCGS
ncbi:hypothetical protein [Sphingomonas pseudosanguinis]|uniref:Uncharacterized protein n=1 Tax=Sphingomonas pseudosanguinis TaxID=413712 RepID=A0A7W6F1A8_9SPHN|nr:hypothetical protein [Sphingomonas pseudosanguinis]MBB3877799.1 hypothetical protein [Sphingomonas pseudosanguinis]MBN3537674.1 hypothetical protein [Sphingomonas pseudosanguinis]